MLTLLTQNHIIRWKVFRNWFGWLKVMYVLKNEITYLILERIYWYTQPPDKIYYSILIKRRGDKKNKQWTPPPPNCFNENQNRNLYNCLSAYLLGSFELYWRGLKPIWFEHLDHPSLLFVLTLSPLFSFHASCLDQFG